MPLAKKEISRHHVSEDFRRSQQKRIHELRKAQAPKRLYSRNGVSYEDFENDEKREQPVQSSSEIEESADKADDHLKQQLRGLAQNFLEKKRGYFYQEGKLDYLYKSKIHRYNETDNDQLMRQHKTEEAVPASDREDVYSKRNISSYLLLGVLRRGKNRKQAQRTRKTREARARASRKSRASASSEQH